MIWIREWEKIFSTREFVAVRSAKDQNCLDIMFVDFQRCVDACAVHLPGPPHTLLPFDRDAGVSLQRMQQSLKRAINKPIQSQFLADSPKLTDDIEAALQNKLVLLDQDAFINGGLVRPDLERLRQSLSYRQAKANAIALSCRQPNRAALPHSTLKKFFTILEGYRLGRNQSFTEDQQIVLTQLVVLGAQKGGTPSSALSLLEWAARIVDETDEPTWSALYTLEHLDAGCSLADINQTAALCCACFATDDFANQIDALLDREIGIPEFLRHLDDLHRKTAKNDSPEKSLAELRHLFSGAEFPLSENSCDRLFEIYAASVAQSADLKGLGEAEFRQRIAEQMPDSETPASKKSALCLALASEGIRRHFGLIPYSTQGMVFLALLFFGPRGVPGS